MAYKPQKNVIQRSRAGLELVSFTWADLEKRPFQSQAVDEVKALSSALVLDMEAANKTAMSNPSIPEGNEFRT